MRNAAFVVPFSRRFKIRVKAVVRTVEAGNESGGAGSVESV